MNAGVSLGMGERQHHSLAMTLGLGEVPPFLSPENQALHERLMAEQSGLAELRADGEREAEDVGQLFAHLESVVSTSANAKSFLQARREERAAETGMESIAE